MESVELVSTNGIQLECLTAGEGPVVLLLHGFPDTSACWKVQIPRLAATHKVVAPNLRGYGRSDKPRLGYTLPNLAADIAGLMDHYSPEHPVSLVGHDWGGAIAWEVIRLYPNRVKDLAILNAPHPGTFPRAVFTTRQWFRSWYFFCFQCPLIPEWVLRTQKGWGLRFLVRLWGAKLSESEVEEVVRPLLTPGVVEAGLRYYRQAFRDSLRSLIRGRWSDHLFTCQHPVKVFWGERDSCLGASLVETLVPLCPNLETEFFPHAGHWLTREEEADVSEGLVAWLRS